MSLIRLHRWFSRRAGNDTAVCVLRAEPCSGSFPPEPLQAPCKNLEEYPTSHRQWPLWPWPRKESGIGKFPSHKRYCSYRVGKGNVLGWQLNDEAHNEQRALLFYICNVLCLSQSCHRSPVDECGGGMRATTKCTFHCSDVREPELLSQELHSDKVSLKGEEQAIPAHHHQLCWNTLRRRVWPCRCWKAHSTLEQLSLVELPLEQSWCWLFCSRPNQMCLQKSFTTTRAVGGESWRDAGS